MSKEIIINKLNECAFGLETQAGEKLKVIDSIDFEQIADELVKKLNIAVVNSENKEVRLHENWWHELSDNKTNELLIKHNIKLPIKKDDIELLYKTYK